MHSLEVLPIAAVQETLRGRFLPVLAAVLLLLTLACWLSLFIWRRRER